MPLLSPILDGFLNDNQSPEALAETHKLTVREVLDLLESDEAAQIFRRLAQVERMRQHVLGARARSKALATLDYLTIFDRHAKHADCDLRRRASEAILKQTAAKPSSRRAPSAPRSPDQLPDLIRLRAARIAADHHDDAISNSSESAAILSAARASSASITLPHPSPLFDKLAQRSERRHPLPLYPVIAKTAAKPAPCMNSASCTSHAQSGVSCACGSSDDG